MAENNTSNSKKVHQGRTLKTLRESYGWKQDVMAEKLDVVQQSVSRYEMAEIVDDDVLQKYSAIFHVPVDVLQKLKIEAPIKEINYNGEVHIEGNNIDTVNTNSCDVYNITDCPDKFTELSRKKGDILNNLSQVDQERSTEIKQVLDTILNRLSDLEAKINAK